MLAKEIERKPERILNRHEYIPKKKETSDSKNKELLKKVVCYGCGQTGHMVKDKNCPKNNKDKKKTTMQIYVAREDESEESELYGGSQYSLEGEEVGFENKSQEEEEVWMHTYRTEEFEEDFGEIEELDEEDQPMEKNSNDEGIIKDSRSDSEDHEDDDPIQEFPTGESEIEGTEELEPYKTEDKIVYESQVLFSALKEGRELPP